MRHACVLSAGSVIDRNVRTYVEVNHPSGALLNLGLILAGRPIIIKYINPYNSYIIFLMLVKM